MVLHYNPTGSFLAHSFLSRQQQECFHDEELTEYITLPLKYSNN
jgi:hypothetical protein